MTRSPDDAHMSPSPSPTRPPLLRLTPDIRLRLYHYLGLASWDGSPFRFDLRGGRADYRPHGCPPAPICFYGLLLSCRTIYAEAVALLYSANCFVVHHHSPAADSPGLQPLGALTKASLRSLSNLKIVVNEAACHAAATPNNTISCCRQGREDDDDWSAFARCRGRHHGIHQPPLLTESVSDVSADDARREWQAAAARVFSWITSGRLALSLVCDIDPQHPLALDLGNSILAPFRLLPRSYLKKCQIRLAETPDRQFQQLAQDAVSHACGLPTRPQPSKRPSNIAGATLASLPRELRVRILEYTDLITPRRQVTWSRQDRAYVVYRFRKGEDRTPDELHSEQFFECWDDRPEGCFCARRHAAFSLTCRCWAPPGPTLFLVCRTLCWEAQYVFFSGNRFIIHD